MVTVEVRCHTDKNLEMPFENKYARVYFMVEIFGGVSSVSYDYHRVPAIATREMGK
jgi:hypothetical protein